MVHDVFEQSYKQEQACEEEGLTLAMSNMASKVHAFSSPKNKANISGQASKNMFDNLPSLGAPMPKELCDELDWYLSTDLEVVKDVLMWWHKHLGISLPLTDGVGLLDDPW